MKRLPLAFLLTFASVAHALTPANVINAFANDLDVIKRNNTFCTATITTMQANAYPVKPSETVKFISGASFIQEDALDVTTVRRELDRAMMLAGASPLSPWQGEAALFRAYSHPDTVPYLYSVLLRERPNLGNAFLISLDICVVVTVYR